MTYQELLAILQKQSPETLKQDVTVLDTTAEEFYPILSTFRTREDDVLDKNHLVLCFAG